MSTPNNEMSVVEAATLLGVTSRSVLNYIKSKEIEAIKVGKAWHIKRPSVEAFSSRYGLYKKEADEPNIQEVPEKINVSLKTHSLGQPPARQIADDRFTVKKLRAFSLTEEVLNSIDFEATFTDPDLKIEIRDRLNSCIALLGAGYYSFEIADKISLYGKARENLGAVIALMYYHLNKDTNGLQIIAELESKLLPAYSSLIKRLDKKRERS